MRFGNHCIGTPKTEPFRLALLRGDSKPGDLSVIPVVDRHICWGATNGKVQESPSDKLQALIILAIHDIAIETGISVTLVQSWVWHSVCRVKGHSDVIKPFEIGHFAVDATAAL